MFSKSTRFFFNSLHSIFRDFYFIKVKILFMKEFVKFAFGRQWKTCLDCKENYKNLLDNSQIFYNNLIIFSRVWIHLIFSISFFLSCLLQLNLYFSLQVNRVSFDRVRSIAVNLSQCRVTHCVTTSNNCQVLYFYATLFAINYNKLVFHKSRSLEKYLTTSYCC